MRRRLILLVALAACGPVEPEQPEPDLPPPTTVEHQATLDSVVADVGAYRDSIFQRLYPNPREIPTAASPMEAEILRAIYEIERAQRLSDIQMIRLLCWSSLNCDVSCPYRETRCQNRGGR